MVIGIIAVLAAIGSAVICAWMDSFAKVSWLWLFPVSWLGCFLGILLLAFAFILVLCAFVDLNKEQEKDNKLYRYVTYCIADAAHTVFRVRVHSKGVERIPNTGRILLVCNHLSNADPVVLLQQLKKRQTVAFISKRENASMFVVGKLMHKMLCQLINRENDREALKTILKCIDIIKEDKASIAVFPEGYIYGDDLLHPFRGGVFKIALRTHVPIVVCTLQNTQPIFHNGLRLKPTDVEFHVVGVLQPEDYQGMTAVQVAHIAHDMMAEDLGPDLVLSVEETP